MVLKAQSLRGKIQEIYEANGTLFTKNIPESFAALKAVKGPRKYQEFIDIFLNNGPAFWQNAHRKLQALYKTHSEDYLFSLALGEYYRLNPNSNDDLKKALKYLRKAQRIQPKSYAARTNLAIYLSDYARYQSTPKAASYFTEALDLFSLCINEKPRSPGAWYNYAFCLLQNGREAMAGELFKHLSTDFPDFVDNYLGLIDAFEGRDEYLVKTAAKRYKALGGTKDVNAYLS